MHEVKFKRERVYEQCFSETYQRRLFAPHGEFDIFNKSHDEQQILPILQELEAESEENESNLNVPEDARPPIVEYAKKSGYKPSENPLPRAKENCYDPDSKEAINERECQEAEDYMAQVEADHVAAQIARGLRIQAPSKEVRLQEDVVCDLNEEYNSDSDAFISTPPKQHEQKAHNPKKNKHRMKEMRKRKGR